MKKKIQQTTIVWMKIDFSIKIEMSVGKHKSENLVKCCKRASVCVRECVCEIESIDRDTQYCIHGKLHKELL